MSRVRKIGLQNLLLHSCGKMSRLGIMLHTFEHYAERLRLVSRLAK